MLDKGLPLSILPQAKNPDGKRYQGRLVKVDRYFLSILTGSEIGIAAGDKVTVEFRLKDKNCIFETTVHRRGEHNGLLLDRPRKIRKKQSREGPRVPYVLPMFYTNWNESGTKRDRRREATLLDISESGMRIRCGEYLSRGWIITVDAYLKDARVRVITQASVTWCRLCSASGVYEAGVQFNTISNETKNRLGSFVNELAKSLPKRRHAIV